MAQTPAPVVVEEDAVIGLRCGIDVCVTAGGKPVHGRRLPGASKTVQVPAGFDAADNRIVELACSGDLVITADIPLAAAALDKGATCSTLRKLV